VGFQAVDPHYIVVDAAEASSLEAAFGGVCENFKDPVPLSGSFIRAGIPKGSSFSANNHHIRWMAKEHPHAGAAYRVVPQKDSTYGVEVIVAGSFPAMVTSFATEEIAEAWITDYKRRVAQNAPRHFMRRNSRT
jgi:hypothetical protein